MAAKTYFQTYFQILKHFSFDKSTSHAFVLCLLLPHVPHFTPPTESKLQFHLQTCQCAVDSSEPSTWSTWYQVRHGARVRVVVKLVVTSWSNTREALLSFCRFWEGFPEEKQGVQPRQCGEISNPPCDVSWGMRSLERKLIGPTIDPIFAEIPVFDSPKIQLFCILQDGSWPFFQRKRRIPWDPDVDVDVRSWYRPWRLWLLANTAESSRDY